jgi:hypothetical protein
MHRSWLLTPSSAQRRFRPHGVGDAGARSSGGQSAALIRPRPLVRVQARPPATVDVVTGAADAVVFSDFPTGP